MNEVISFVEKHLNEIKPIDYFLILAVLLLSIPYIYRFIKNLFQDRMESSSELIKIKDDIIGSQEKRTNALTEELDRSKRQIYEKNIKLQQASKIFYSIQTSERKLSKLTKIKIEYDTVSVNRVLASIFVTLSNLSFISTVKSMIVLYSESNVQNTYPDAPSVSTLINMLTELEQKVTTQLPDLDEVSFESILLSSDEISKGFAPDNLDLDFKQLYEWVEIMEGYLIKCSEQQSVSEPQEKQGA